MRVALLTRSLNYGGAERQLVALARGLAERGHTVDVLVFYGGGPLTGGLAAPGIAVHDLAKRGRWDVFGFLLRLARALRASRADVVHAYLVAPNLLAVLLRPLVAPAAVVWGVRASDMDLSRYDALARFTFLVSRVLARYPDKIVVNSDTGLTFHAAAGYPPERMEVIPNGIDTGHFAPDPAAGRAQREAWGIAAGHPLVGRVGRLDPMKDHRTFLEAAGRLAAERDDVRFALVGDGPLALRAELERRAGELGLAGKLVWAGTCDDMRAVHNAFDVEVSSSRFGEGFPNVIAEALACGTPCVVTDVGDARQVVGPHGIVVKPGDPAELAAGIARALADRGAGEDGRRRVCRLFSVERLIDRTEAVLAGLTRRRRRSAVARVRA